jgi:hypothetical protein
MQPGKQLEISFKNNKPEKMSQFEIEQENARVFLEDPKWDENYRKIKDTWGWAISTDQAKDRVKLINQEVGFDLSTGYHMHHVGAFGRERHPVIVDMLTPAQVREKYLLGMKKAA